MELPYKESCLHNWIFDGILRQDVYFIKSRKGVIQSRRQTERDMEAWGVSFLEDDKLKQGRENVIMSHHYAVPLKRYKIILNINCIERG